MYAEDGRSVRATMGASMDDLIARFRNGESEAVREVYRRYAGPVGTVARSMVGDPELVAEVVQQTFLKAWQASAAFDADRELSPWLYAIARRTAIDVLRRERRPTAGDHERERDVGVDAPSFERTWEAFEVRRAVDDLPAKEREAVRLSYLIGFTHTEIAEQLGVPVGTVKSRLARAHGRLVAALAHLDLAANRQTTSPVEDGER
jgi:RNA polymerase sigma-70 factor, ECF subfamily